MAVPCTLSSDKVFVNVNALIDSGVTSVRFMDFEFARSQQFLLFALLRSRVLKTFDDNLIVFGKIIHAVRGFLHIEKHQKNDALFYLSRLNHHSVILGHA